VPKVSVIIPTYNRVESLQLAIESVLAQTFQDFEIVLVDDAPPGYARGVVASFDDRRIRYICHEINKGDAASRNTGILNSRGDYLAFLDDDDEWLPGKLQMQVDVLTTSSPDVGGVFTGKMVIDRATGKISGIFSHEQGINSFGEMFTGNVINTSSIMVKKKCFEILGLFDEGIPYCSDYDMWIRISKDFRLQCIKQPLVKYFIHGNSLTNDYAKGIQGREILVARYGRFSAQNSKGFSHLYRSLGILYGYEGSLGRARDCFLSSIKIRPFEIRGYYYLCLVLLSGRNFKTFSGVKEKLTAMVRRLFPSQTVHN
jgi:glycosyltransferase involved in cell wall biosynthesis